jgi:integration host factor subunit beta
VSGNTVELRIPAGSSRLVGHLPHLYLRDVEMIVDAIFDRIVGALCDGDRVGLRGFGSFRVKRRPPRDGRNPRTGEDVAVPEKWVPAFKGATDLRRRLNIKG